MIFKNDKRSFGGSCCVKIGNKKAYNLTSLAPKNQSGSGIDGDNIGGPPYVVGGGRLSRWGKRLVTYGRRHLPGITKQLANIAKNSAKNIATDVAANHGSAIAEEAAAALGAYATKKGVSKAITGYAQDRIGQAGKNLQASARKEGVELNFGEQQISNKSKSLLQSLLAKKAESRLGIKGNGVRILGKGTQLMGNGARNEFDNTLSR